jgi:CRP-like cAMP-binding protein
MASEPREAFGDLATTAFVESSILFRSLDEGARLDLLQVGRIQSYSPDEVISGEGDDRFMILQDGSASVIAAGPAGSIELYRLERGALFGVGRALGRSRGAYLQALTDVTVVTFPAPVLTVLSERFPKVRKLLEAVQAARDKEAAARLAG